jgi:hypothetical protein
VVGQDVAMGLFRRGRRDDAPPPDAIAQFWAWWQAEGRAATATAVADRAPERAGQAVSAHVGAIHPDLAWELAAGTSSAHVLVVSPEGNPDLRSAARRWLRGAPPADATWAYADTRQPVEDLDDLELEVNGRVIAFKDVVITARREGLRIPVAVYHPVFPDVDNGTRLTITYLALDAVLGEEDVECWVGEVTATESAPLDAFPLKWLRGLVRDLKAEHTTPDGEPHYVMFQGNGADGPLVAMAQVPLAAATAPELDTHVAVFLPYLSTNDSGLPSPGSLDALRRLEDSLTLDLEDRGRLVAHQSSAGTRVLHVYVDGTTDAADRVRAAAQRWTEGSAAVTVTHDPGWEMVSHLRG